MSMTDAEHKIRDQIIHKIKVNRISTTEVADCLGKTGVLPGVLALNRNHFAVGPAYLTIAVADSNWPAHERFQDIPAGAVVIVERVDCGSRSPIGALMAKFAILYREAAAIVVNGPVRDAPHLIKENWPVWSSGVNPIGCFNGKPPEEAGIESIKILEQQYDDTIVVCDDTGVVLIPKERQNDEFLKSLDFIEEQEDIWADCVNRRKWTTFDTICLKKYLDKDE